MPLSLSPSLSAPSVSPSLIAVVLPVSLSQAVLPAASKAADLRAEAVKAVSDWKTSHPASALTAAQSVAPSISADNPSFQLDALFDGLLPTSREVLSRAESRSLHPVSLARALSDSKSPTDAASRLSALGILGSKEAFLAASNEDEFRFLLTRLWRKTAQSLSADSQIDASFGIPALKVQRDGTTYFVHAVAHGQFGPPRRAAVLSLVRRVQAAGHALYSEQNLPAYYGYKSGFETLDHAASALPSVVPAAPGYTRATLLLKRAIDWVVAPGSALAALGWVIAVPASAPAWVLLPILSVLSWLVLTGGLPLMRWKRRRLAAGARAEGFEDIAEQYADEAANFFVAKPDLKILKGLELPQPLGATSDPLSARSRAIADAVAADAATSGASAVHLVVGHLHAHEIVWCLAEGPRTTVPGAQI